MHTHTFSHKSIRNIVGAVAVLSLSLFAWYHFAPTHGTGVVTYNTQRDREFILNEFKQNMYCLVSEKVSFSPEHMLDTRSSSQRAEDFENAGIYVYCEAGVPVGFLVIHPTREASRILFLEIAQEHRKKGYGRKLMNFAVDKLRREGYAYTDIATRIENIPAQTLYRSLGAFEIDRYDGFLSMRLYL